MREDGPPTTPINIDLKHAHNKCSTAELDSCRNAVRNSEDNIIKLLPNHHIGSDAELHGYYFQCKLLAKASELPVSKKTFDMMSMYECLEVHNEHTFNPTALNIVNNLPHYKQVLENYIRDLQANPLLPAHFDCIADQNVHAGSHTYDTMDTREWRPEVPYRVGVYHTFTRSSSKDCRRHKVCIIVSGSLTEAAEGFHNLWQDSADHITCSDLLKCEELNWLRSCTHRNHNRIASDIARLFGLDMHHVMDADDPSQTSTMVYPSTHTLKNDIGMTDDNRTQHARLVDSGCFSDISSNGILFEMFGSEGYWLFQGPRDYSDSHAQSYGSVFASTNEFSCIPTSTVAFHPLYQPVNRYNTVRVAANNPHNSTTQEPVDTELVNEFLFPDESFFHILEELGYNRNDQTLVLMPLVYYEQPQV